MQLNKLAFTLIELLVVIAVIGILSGLIVVSMSGTTDKATIAKSQVFSSSLRNSIMLDLSSEWKLEGNVNDNWASNHGSTSGSPTVLTTGCVQGSCYDFDGSNDYLIIPDNNTLDFLEDYTIEMFAYNGAGTLNYPTLFNKAGQSGTNGFFWSYSTGTNETDIAYQWCNSSTSAANGTTFSNIFPREKWTHLVFTFTNSTKTLKLYTNGNLYPTTRTLTGALPVDDGVLYFGNYNLETVNYFFKGKMDEIRWYKVAVPASIIREHYYSAMNNMLISGQMSKEEYLSHVSN